jgi:hypothetical protein
VGFIPKLYQSKIFPFSSFDDHFPLTLLIELFLELSPVEFFQTMTAFPLGHHQPSQTFGGINEIAKLFKNHQPDSQLRVIGDNHNGDGDKRSRGRGFLVQSLDDRRFSRND